MWTSVLYEDKCTLCGQVYSMWTSVLDVDRCTKYGQVHVINIVCVLKNYLADIQAHKRYRMKVPRN